MKSDDLENVSLKLNIAIHNGWIYTYDDATIESKGGLKNAFFYDFTVRVEC